MTAPRPREARAGAGLRLLRAAVFTAVCVALSAAGHSLASEATVPLWTLAAGFGGLLLVVVPLAGRQRSLPGITAVLAVGQIALHTLFGLGQCDMAVPNTAAGAGLTGGAARLVRGAAAAAAGAGHPGTAVASGAERSGAMAAHMPGMSHMADMTSGSGAVSSQLAEAHMAGAAPGAAGVLGQTGGLPGLADASLPAPHTVSLLHLVPMLPSLPMVLGHLLAAVVAGWLLRRGDLAVFRLLALSAQGVAEAALVRALRAALALVCALRAGLPCAGRTGPRPPHPAAPAPPPPHAAVLQHTVIRRGPPRALPCLLAA
ncbi:hypothetical protein GCM10018793_03240 [Streptomyces sulfonofaciens]|uniref:Integral membrane protein n=1 Tax=Streptomyces sulfonofaciens TaxID=68272 RepID=A0A919FQ89_9ACTN|nr:hypothetical protein [Streptomyces sulfonofaciens]GHH69948.1 hypothetical protein GCM10018793_03240 [Streptomyces sulfonofaciens]